MNNFDKTRVFQIAKTTNTILTDNHLKVLEFISDYYSKHKVGPLYHMIKKNIGISRSDLNKMFPHGLYSAYQWIEIPIQTPEKICKHIAEVEVMEKREIYFDHNATTYVRDEVAKGLKDYFNGEYGYGNPSSGNILGKNAYSNVYESRVQIAKHLKCDPNEIIFTGSGSEANNLAIKGIAFNHLKNKGHIISSMIEHPAVLETLEWLRLIGFEITLLCPDKEGLISPEDVKSAIRNNTILVTLMAANNEIGTINPLNEIGSICKLYNIPFFVDAIQGFGKMILHPKKMGISMLSISGHKIYAPKGVGALFLDKEINLAPVIHGGGQEQGLRAGTENVAYIMALGKAASVIYKEFDIEHKRLTELRDYFLERLGNIEPDFIINGSLEKRLPNNLNIGFPDIDSGALLLSLNQIGVYVSSGSACHEGSKETSHVIHSIGVDTVKYGVIRFSFGIKNSKEDVDYLFEYLPEILRKLKILKKETQQ